jgi:hypothetical protein
MQLLRWLVSRNWTSDSGDGKAVTLSRHGVITLQIHLSMIVALADKQSHLCSVLVFVEV